ncbi:unnamed protein product, partial [Brenthis ino]
MQVFPLPTPPSRPRQRGPQERRVATCGAGSVAGPDSCLTGVHSEYLSRLLRHLALEGSTILFCRCPTATEKEMGYVKDKPDE